MSETPMTDEDRAEAERTPEGTYSMRASVPSPALGKPTLAEVLASGIVGEYLPDDRLMADDGYQRAVAAAERLLAWLESIGALRAVSPTECREPSAEEIARVLNYAAEQMGWGPHVKPFPTVAALKVFMDERCKLWAEDAIAEAAGAVSPAERREPEPDLREEVKTVVAIMRDANWPFGDDLKGRVYRMLDRALRAASPAPDDPIEEARMAMEAVSGVPLTRDDAQHFLDSYAPTSEAWREKLARNLAAWIGEAMARQESPEGIARMAVDFALQTPAPDGAAAGVPYEAHTPACQVQAERNAIEGEEPVCVCGAALSGGAAPAGEAAGLLDAVEHHVGQLEATARAMRITLGVMRAAPAGECPHGNVNPPTAICEICIAEAGAAPAGEARRDDGRDSLAQEIRATLAARGLWAPANPADLISAVGKALDDLRRAASPAGQGDRT